MKKILMALAVACFTGSRAKAQSDLIPNLPLTRVESLQMSLIQVAPAQQRPSRTFSNNPIPVLPSQQDGPAPCPAGDGKSCALLGGRVYFSDPIHMTEHDATLGKAVRNPAM